MTPEQLHTLDELTNVHAAYRAWLLGAAIQLVESRERTFAELLRRRGHRLDRRTAAVLWCDLVEAERRGLVLLDVDAGELTVRGPDARRRTQPAHTPAVDPRTAAVTVMYQLAGGVAA